MPSRPYPDDYFHIIPPSPHRAGEASSYEETRTVTHRALPSDPPTYQGAPVPQDVTLAPGRCSQDERDRVAAHLRDMAANGFMDDNELNSRLAHVDRAVTRSELGMLASDLPALPPVKRRQAAAGESAAAKPLSERVGVAGDPVNLVAVLAAFVVSACFIVVPWVLMSGAHKSPIAAAAYAFAAVATLCGIAGVAGTLIWCGRVYKW